MSRVREFNVNVNPTVIVNVNVNLTVIVNVSRGATSVTSETTKEKERIGIRNQLFMI